jgi:hypothetical protein
MQLLPPQKPPSSIAMTACALFGAPMPQYLNALIIATNRAIANTGTTSIFIIKGTDMDSKRITHLPLQINFTDRMQIQSTHVCNLIISGLPTVSTGHIVPSLSTASLIEGFVPCAKLDAKYFLTIQNAKSFLMERLY